MTPRPAPAGESPGLETSGQSADARLASEPTARRRPERGGFAVLAARLWRWPHFDAAVLWLLVVAIAALNQVWISIETRPPHWDMARHLGDSLVYFDTFSLAHLLHWAETYLYYAPFTYWVTDVFYAVFGTGVRTAIFSNVVFLAVLTFSTYAIGRRLWNRRVGLLSAVFVLSTPMIVSNFKEYMVDAPLTAVVALSLYLLIRSESFARRGPSLLLGLVSGLGLLTKWTFPVFVAVPYAVAGLVAIAWSVRRRSLGRVANIVAAALLALLVCGLWYVHNWGQLQTDVRHFAGVAGAIKGSPPVSSIASLDWYFWGLINAQLYAFPFALFALGIVFVFRRSDAAARNVQPVLLIIGTWAISTCLRNKDLRYTLPMLPAVAIVATSWLECLRPGLRRGLSGAVVVYGAVAFLAISFGTSLLPTSATAGSAEPTKPGVTFFAQHGYVIGPPTHEHWYQQQVFQQIARGGEAPTFWFSGSDSIWFNTWGTRYYMLLYGLSWVATPGQANFLVIRASSPPSVPTGFGQLHTWPLPDGGTLYLYKRFFS